MSSLPMSKLTPGKMVTANVRLVRPLRQGGMGSIWLAEHLTLESQVAVKFISAEAIGRDSKALARFRREAKAAAKIHSPHVVQMFDFGTMSNGTPYIVMELLRGTTLTEFRQRTGRLSLGEAAMVVRQIAKAITAAHQLGVVHRDIKPDNIYVLNTGTELFVKVLDFGIARTLNQTVSDTLTAIGTVMGTPNYISPEQLLSSGKVLPSSDLWSLAVVAYELVTGVLPFAGETLPALLVSITRGTIQPASQVADVPSRIDPFFARALKRDVSHRFSTAMELADAFADVCRNAVPAARTPLISYDETLWTTKVWRVRNAEGDAEVGPVSLQQLFDGLRAGKLPADAVVTRQDDENWELASLVLIREAASASVMQGGGPASPDSTTRPVAGPTFATEPMGTFLPPGVVDSGGYHATMALQDYFANDMPPVEKQPTFDGASATLDPVRGPSSTALRIAILVGIVVVLTTAVVAIVAISS